jgi:protocatechuate 3,4-dioxygenase beta subunit
MKKIDLPKQSRREILRSLGGAAAATLFGCGTSKIVTTSSGSGTSTSSASSGSSSASSTSACLVESSTTRGPYFVDTINDTNNVATSGTPYTIDALIPQRSDIRADTEGTAGTQQGVQLVLNVTLYDSSCSSVISGARVDIWHANAHGAYSDIKNAGNDGGADHTSENFLRGYQFSDANGLVTFTTVYPGAYSGRCPHIHLKIRIINSAGVVTTENTTQLFFTDATSASVYAASSNYSTSSYNTKDTADQIYNSESPTLIPTLTGDTTSGLTGTIAIGVDVGKIYAGN